MNVRTLIQVIIVLIVGTALHVQAATDSPSAPTAAPEATREQDKQRGDASDGSRHFEAKRRERLIEILQLDEATRAKLLQRLEQLDRKADDLRRERREAFMALREQAKSLRGGARKGDRKKQPDPEQNAASKVDPAALKAALDRVYAVEEAMPGLRRERFQIMRDVLTPEQQVKFLMYSMKFHKEMKERLERERGGAGDRPQHGGRERESP
jgi:Spy/CpxP family protein refolding chaperone